jgi:hypothetical protein
MNSTCALIGQVPGADADSRLALFLQVRGGKSQVQLCQQNWAEGIGWFTQSSIDIQADQVAGLRQALGIGSSRVDGKARPKPTSHRALRVVG